MQGLELVALMGIGNGCVFVTPFGLHFARILILDFPAAHSNGQGQELSVGHGVVEVKDCPLVHLAMDNSQAASS